MWAGAIVLVCSLLGLFLLTWGAHQEEIRRLHRLAATAEHPDWPVHEPQCVTDEEMEAMGWQPLNDGSGLWKLDLSK